MLMAGSAVSFEPTYEGLKPAFAQFTATAKLTGFEPTYEGLKLRTNRHCLHLPKVLSLPTRD